MRGRIQIRYTVGKQRYEETLDLKPTQSGIADAVRIRKERIQARRFGHAVEEHPFEEVAQAYLDRANVAHSTRNSYRDSLNIYWSGLAGRDVASITVADLIALDDSILWSSKKTRNNALVPLRQVFSFGVARGYCLSNPSTALRAAKRKVPEPDPYTADERDSLLDCLDRTLAGPFFRVAFGTGARTGELLALSWADFDGSSLWVKQSRTRGRLKDTKTGIKRKVLLLPDTVNVLKSMPRPIKGGPIFTNQYGRHYQSGYHLNKWFRKAHKDSGVRPRSGPYPWRHTYASLALSAGVKPALIASQLGHRLDVLLSTYGRYIPREDDAAELAKMGATWVQDGSEAAK